VTRLPTKVVSGFIDKGCGILSHLNNEIENMTKAADAASRSFE